VDRERIGVIGICGWGGMALNAVAVDKRVKAVVATHDVRHDPRDVEGLQRQRHARTADADARTAEPTALGGCGKGDTSLRPALNELKGGEAQFLVDYHDYYKTPRGYHPSAVNSNNSWTVTNPLSFMNMPILSYIKEISPTPASAVHGEKAHSRYFSETAFAAAAEPKELVIIPAPATSISTTGSTLSRSAG
jgi:hypothetical protein